MQPSGDPKPQKEPELERPKPQVQNPEGGYVFPVSDVERLRRFLFLGKEIAWQDSKPEEDAKIKKPEKIGDLIERMIKVGEVDALVQTIRQVSADKTNLRQDQLLRALAICCESSRDEPRKKAYTILNTVCRTPWHLFTFLHECAGTANPKGWDRTKKKAVGEWYRQFESKPFDLAMMVTKYKKRQGWSHKDVLRMAHVKCTEEEPQVAFILSYIMKGYTKACEYHKIAEKKELTELADRLKMYDTAKSYNGKTYRDGSSGPITEFCKLIRDNHLCWEHVASEMLNKPEVWEALLEDMPVEAMLKSLGKLTRLNLFPDKDDQNIAKVENILQEKNVHPFKVLVTYYQYCKEEGGLNTKRKRSLNWVPNMKIKEALENTFYNKVQRIESAKKRFCLAIDVSESMTCKVQSFTCMEAAVAMATMILQTEDGNVIGFSDEVDKVVHLKLDRKSKLDEAMLAVKGLNTESDTDCALPIKWATKKKEDRKTDVFVIFTDNFTWSENMHVMNALKEYRNAVQDGDVKLVVCTMCASEFTIKDCVNDANVLNINGFDPDALDCLKDFCDGQSSSNMEIDIDDIEKMLSSEEPTSSMWAVQPSDGANIYTEQLANVHIISVVSRVLRKNLLQELPPGQDLRAFLISNDSKLKELHRRRVITDPQMKLLHNCPDFDYTRLVRLSTQVVNLQALTREWRTPPNPSDTSLGADLARQRYWRNRFAQSPAVGMKNEEFNQLWTPEGEERNSIQQEIADDILVKWHYSTFEDADTNLKDVMDQIAGLKLDATLMRGEQKADGTEARLERDRISHTLLDMELVLNQFKKESLPRQLAEIQNRLDEVQNHPKIAERLENVVHRLSEEIRLLIDSRLPPYIETLFNGFEEKLQRIIEVITEGQPSLSSEDLDLDNKGKEATHWL